MYVILNQHFMYDHNIGDGEHIFVFVEEGEKIVIVKLNRGHTLNLPSIDNTCLHI